MPFDFKKECRNPYQPRTIPGLIDVPAVQFLAVEGTGDLREEGEAYNAPKERLRHWEHTW